MDKHECQRRSNELLIKLESGVSITEAFMALSSCVKYNPLLMRALAEASEDHQRHLQWYSLIAGLSWSQWAVRHFDQVGKNAKVGKSGI